MEQFRTSYILGVGLSVLMTTAEPSALAGQGSEKAESDKANGKKVVTVLRDSDCGSDAISRVKEVADRHGIDITVEEIIVESEDQAKALNWPGSPTVRIKGVDIDPKMRDKKSYAMG